MITDALAAMMVALEPVSEAVDGHRAQALARGYSESAAEAMAVSFHQFLLATLAGANAS